MANVFGNIWGGGGAGGGGGGMMGQPGPQRAQMPGMGMGGATLGGMSQAWGSGGMPRSRPAPTPGGSSFNIHGFEGDANPGMARALNSNYGGMPTGGGMPSSMGGDPYASFHNAARSVDPMAGSPGMTQSPYADPRGGLPGMSQSPYAPLQPYRGNFEGDAMGGDPYASFHGAFQQQAMPGGLQSQGMPGGGYFNRGFK